MDSPKGLWITLIVLIGVHFAYGIPGNVGYYGYSRSQSRTLRTEPIGHQNRILLLEPRRTFLSDNVKVTKIISDWQTGGKVKFQVYTLVMQTSPNAAIYRLKSESTVKELFKPGIDDFLLDQENLIADYGDVLAIYFPGQNPIPYYDAVDCNISDTSSHYWATAALSNAPVVRVDQVFLAAPFGEGSKCREYMVQVETQFTQDPTGMKKLGFAPVQPELLTETDVGTGNLVVVQPDQRIKTPFTVLGWKAFFKLPNTKVRFVVLQALDGKSFYLNYMSEPYVTYESRDIEIRLPGLSTIYSDSVIALWFEEENPIPFNVLSGCPKSSESLEIPVSQVNNKSMIYMEPRDENPCRQYAFSLSYKELQTGPRSTTHHGPRECTPLRAKSAEQSAESSRSDRPGKDQTIRPIQCWQIEAEDVSLYPRVKILENNLQPEDECDLYAPNLVEMRDGAYASGELRGQLCDGKAGVTVDACKENTIYLLVKTTKVHGKAGIKFVYSAVTEDERTCEVVRKLKVEEVVSGAAGHTTVHLLGILVLQLVLFVI